MRWPGRRRWSERRARAARRLAWPSVADEIGSALRSGASLRQALGAVAAHGGAAAPRLSELLHPVSRGDDVPAAARRWADSSDDADERLLAGAVELAAGATRAEPVLFDTVARTLRERAALAGEMRAQTAQARASAAALSALPLAFTGLSRAGRSKCPLVPRGHAARSRLPRRRHGPAGPGPVVDAPDHRGGGTVTWPAVLLAAVWVALVIVGGVEHRPVPRLVTLSPPAAQARGVGSRVSHRSVAVPRCCRPGGVSRCSPSAPPSWRSSRWDRSAPRWPRPPCPSSSG